MTDPDAFPSELPQECERCGETFANSSNRHRHLRSAHGLFEIEAPLKDDSYLPVESVIVPTAEEKAALDSFEDLVVKLSAEFSLNPVESIFPTLPATRGASPMSKAQLGEQIARNPAEVIRSHAQRVAADRVGAYVLGPVLAFQRRQAAFASVFHSHNQAHLVEVFIGEHEASVRRATDVQTLAHRVLHQALGLSGPPDEPGYPGSGWGLFRGHTHGPAGQITWHPHATVPKRGEALLHDQIAELTRKVEALTAAKP
jgi:hypothetical protein